MSKLQVETISHTNNTTGITIDSSGRVLTPARPAFFAFPSANFSSGTGAGTTQIFASTQHNVGGHYSTSTGKFTVPIAGVYMFGVSFATDTTASAIVYMSAEVTVNGSVGTNVRYHGGWGDKTSDMNTHHREHYSVQLSLAVNDTAQFSHESNVDVTVLGGNSGRYTSFWGHLIG
tara:strand:+ start:39 stop:563 length:525 start_codon:yes stop_codon:yes gene_type:complete